MWGRFSGAEMRRRRALTDALMDEHNLDALVLFGNSGVNRHNQANVFWLTNHLDLHHCYLVLPREGKPLLLIGLANHVPSAREVSDIAAVEWGGYKPAEKIAERLGVARRVGLVGVNVTFEMGMPYAHYLTLRDRGGEVVDVTRQFRRLRLVKSDEELEWLRRAAELSHMAIVAVAEGARPAMTEVELVALAEHAYRPEGGLPHITFLRYWGYSGQLQRPIFVDAEPAPDWRRLFDAALAAYEGLVDAVRTGATVADAIRAAAPIRDTGFTIYDDLYHGYGVDILPPLVDRAHFEDPPARDEFRFERNMAVVLQPNPTTPDGRMGFQLGALTIVTNAGAESLHHVPLEPLVAA